MGDFSAQTGPNYTFNLPLRAGCNGNPNETACGVVQACAGSANICGGEPAVYPLNFRIVVPANDILAVYYQTDVNFDGSLNTATATVDPVFSIDPSFLAENPGYSLQFSPGIGNGLVSLVPEPDTWVLMLFGLGGLGAALRGSRRSLTVAPATKAKRAA
jgi:hypothetical protein